jgi:alpha-glucosidase (family GH31 glycosyl hydrolase)
LEGNPYTSYASVPHYMTSQARSLFLENYEYSTFDLREDDRVQVGVFSSLMWGQILGGDTPVKLLEHYTEYSGRMRPLPEWIISGAVVGLQGGTDRALQISDELESLDTPIAALWLQDWVGQRKTSFGTQLWWNWELDRDHYPNWGSLRESLEEKNIRVMTYINPFLCDDAAQKKNHRRNLFEEAARKGYLVENQDGEPYRITISSFSAALVDLTNPDAWTWIKEIIKGSSSVRGLRVDGRLRRGAALRRRAVLGRTVPAPIGEPAVFYKEDSAEGTRFREELERRGLL